MRAAPASPYETNSQGLLHGSRRVFVADSSNFPDIPAKNLTFTIMANALRIGEAARQKAEGAA